MEKLRFGILGSGYMGRTHAAAIQHIGNAQLTAVALGSRAPALARDYGAALCGSVEELVRRADVDAIVITTPHFVHAEEALLAAQHDKHLFVEKPMTTTVADADAIIEACAKRKLTLSIGFQQRYRMVNRTTHDLIQQGAIGQVLTIRFALVSGFYTDPALGSDWSWAQQPASVGHILEGGVHAIDLCRWILRSEVATVFGHCRTFRDNHVPENTTMGLMEFRDGTVVSLWASSAVPQPEFPDLAFRAQYMGETGMIDMNAYDKLQLANDGTWRTVIQQPPVNPGLAAAAFGQPRIQAYVDQLAAFTKAALSGEPPPVTGEDGRISVAVALAFLESSRKGEVVHMPA